MPRARLRRQVLACRGDALARLRDKIAGRKTLGEIYGPPLYGIKTGFNEAFVIDRRREIDWSRRPEIDGIAEAVSARRERQALARRKRGAVPHQHAEGKVDIAPIRRFAIGAAVQAGTGRAGDQTGMVGTQQAQLAYQPKFDSIEDRLSNYLAASFCDRSQRSFHKR